MSSTCHKVLVSEGSGSEQFSGFMTQCREAVQDLKDQLIEAWEQIHGLQKENTNCEAIIANLKDEVDIATAERERSEAGLISIRGEMRATRMELEQSRTEANRLKANVQGLRTEMAGVLKTMHEQNSHYQRLVEFLRSNANKSTEAAQRLEKENERLKNELSTIQKNLEAEKASRRKYRTELNRLRTEQEAMTNEANQRKRQMLLLGEELGIRKQPKIDAHVYIARGEELLAIRDTAAQRSSQQGNMEFQQRKRARGSAAENMPPSQLVERSMEIFDQSKSKKRLSRPVARPGNVDDFTKHNKSLAKRSYTDLESGKAERVTQKTATDYDHALTELKYEKE